MYGQMTSFTEDIQSGLFVTSFFFLPYELIACQKVTHLVYDLNHATV